MATFVAMTSCVALLAGCGGAEKESPPKLAVPSDPPVADPTPLEDPLRDPCRAAIDYRSELEQLLQTYGEDHPDVVRLRQLADAAKDQCHAAAGQAPRSGKWIEKDGVRRCDGYMTRRADQDYCSAEIPEGWVPFTFNGREYYMQPLTESVGEPQPGD